MEAETTDKKDSKSKGIPMTKEELAEYEASFKALEHIELKKSCKVK